MKKEIQNLGELESFLKQHNLTYPKIWKSKLKKVKRKDRNSSTWKDCRMALYAVQRTLRCATVIIESMTYCADQIDEKIEKIGIEKVFKLMSKNSITTPMIKKVWREIIFNDKKKYFQKVLKKGGKSYFQRNLTLETLKVEELLGLKIPTIIKLPKKKEAIIEIMEEEEYWYYRNIYLGKPKEDKNNKSIVRKEAQEYFKSVCTYINKPKYNKNFFISHSQPEMEELWEDYWKFYLKVC
jgi:hypothetical protein